MKLFWKCDSRLYEAVFFYNQDVMSCSAYRGLLGAILVHEWLLNLHPQ